MLQRRIYYPFVPMLGLWLIFMIRLIWRPRYSIKGRSFPFISFASISLFGRIKMGRGKKWFLIFWKKEQKFWYNNCNLKKKERSSDRRPVTSPEEAAIVTPKTFSLQVNKLKDKAGLAVKAHYQRIERKAIMRG